MSCIQEGIERISSPIGVHQALDTEDIGVTCQMGYREVKKRIDVRQRGRRSSITSFRPATELRVKYSLHDLPNPEKLLLRSSKPMMLRPKESVHGSLVRKRFERRFFVRISLLSCARSSFSLEGGISRNNPRRWIRVSAICSRETELYTVSSLLETSQHRS